MKTLYLGPDELMVAAKVAVPPGATGADIAATIDSAEQGYAPLFPSPA